MSSGTLAFGTSCTVVVDFKPVANVSYFEAFDIIYDNGITTSNKATRLVEGTGISTLPPVSLSLIHISEPTRPY